MKLTHQKNFVDDYLSHVFMKSILLIHMINVLIWSWSGFGTACISDIAIKV